MENRILGSQHWKGDRAGLPLTDTGPQRTGLTFKRDEVRSSCLDKEGENGWWLVTLEIAGQERA